MIAAVEDRDLDVHHWEAGQIAFNQRAAHALFNRGDELARNHAADDVVLELEAATTLERLDLEPAIAVLAAAPRLALVLALSLGAALDGFFVRHLGRLKFNVYIKFSLELLDRNFDMHLAGAGQDNLVGLRVAMGLQRLVLLDQPLQGLRGLLLVALGLGANRKGNDRRGPRGRGEDDRGFLIAQRIAGGGVLKLGDSYDLARQRGRDRRLLLALQPQQLAEALARAMSGVQHRGAAWRVHDTLDARAAQHGRDFAGDHRRPQRRAQLIVLQHALVEILLEQRVVGLGHGLA